MVGPTFSIDVPSSPPFAGAGNRPNGNLFFSGDSPESSSSIGTPDDSDIENDNVSPKRNRDEEDDDDDEVQSKFKGLISLDSLEDSLPIKLVPLFLNFLINLLIFLNYLFTLSSIFCI